MATYVEKLDAEKDVEFWSESLEGAKAHMGKLISHRDQVRAGNGDSADWLNDRINEIDAVISKLSTGKLRAETRLANLT